MIQLKSIAVSNFRKFIDPVIVSPLKPGINIIAGDNEDGKSTIVTAVKAALYKKYSSTTADELQPYNSSLLPTVCLEFDMGGGSYRLLKAFGRKGTAELRCPNAIFSGSQAEEKLRELLRLGDDKRANTSIWNVLLVEQGKALEQPALAELGKQTLESALENEIGKMVSGDGGNALLTRITQLYSSWFTDTGRHKSASEFKQAEKELEETQAQFEQKKQEYESYKQALADVDETRALLMQHEDKRTVEHAKRALEEAQAAAQAVAKRKLELEKLSAIADAERANYEKIAQLWQSRKQAAEEFHKVESGLQQLKQRCATLQEEMDAAARDLHERQQQEAEAEQRWQQAEAAYLECEKASRVARLTATRKAIEERIAKTKAAHGAAAEAKTAADAIKVDRSGVERLRNFEKRLLQCVTQLEASATRIQFMPTEGNSVSANGSRIDTESPALVTSSTTFDLSGWGALRVVPGSDGIEQLRRTHEQLQCELNDQLASLKVRDVAEAEEQERQKTALVRQHEEHLRDVGKFAPQGIIALQKELESIHGQIQEEGVALDSAMSSDAPPDQAAAARRNAETRALFNQARAAAQNSDKLFRLKADQLRTISAEYAACDKAFKEIGDKLAMHREQEKDEDLAKRFADARDKMEKTAAEKSALELQLIESGAANPRQRIDAAAAALENTQNEIARLRDRQNVLLGSLKTFGKAGIAEEFHKISARKEQLEAQVLRLQKRAAAVKLLYETVLQAQQNAKAHLIKPLLRHLKPYVAEVFDRAELQVDGDSFGITQLSRNDTIENYSSLSIGTQEQLSVLARLSFARVLAENNCPALLILDDVLVYSDADRLLKMQTVLKSAANSFQIVVLTCRPADWQTLDAPILELEKAKQPTAFLSSQMQVPDLSANHLHR